MIRNRFPRVMALALVFSSAATLTSLPQAFAIEILAYEDGLAGTSALPGAFSLLGVTPTTVTSELDFNTQLTSQSWDLVVYAEQANFVFEESNTELEAYVNGGGKLLGITWLATGLNDLLQGNAVSSNDTVITADGHPIFESLGPTIGIINPGWGVYSRSWAPVGSATGIGSLGTGSAAILGNNGATLLLGPLTDTYQVLAEGEQFLANAMAFLLVPEPTTLCLLGLLTPAILVRRR